MSINKKFKSPMLAVMGLAVVASSFVIPNNKAHALTSSDSQYEYEVLDDGTIKITDYLGYSQAITIPSKIDGKTVTILGTNSFYGNVDGDPIISITIPNTVKKIDSFAFPSQYLTSVAIPDSVTEIGESAFKGNDITNLNLGSNVKIIGNSAFNDNQLPSVIIPDSVTEIGSYAFNTNYIATISIGSGLKKIGSYAFSSNKLKSVTLPSTLNLVDSSAFMDNQITKVTVKNPDLMYGESVFFANPSYFDSADNVVMYASKGSTTETYAHTFGHTFYTSTADESATKAVEKAEASLLQTDVDSARILVNGLDDATQKTYLNARLDVVVNKIVQKQLLNDATNAVVLAESTKKTTDVSTAQILVNALLSGTDKILLQGRLDIVTNYINQQQAIAEATEAVVQAETTVTQADVDSARTLVNALDNGTVKNDLSGRLDAVQNVIDKAKAEAEATQATEKAESSKTQDDVDKAKDLVNKLPDGSVKDDLTNRLDKVQDTIDKANAEKAETEAIQAVEKAESSKKQDDVNTAKELVNKLPDGTVKDDLNNRLDKVQEDIDKAKAESEATQATEKAESSKTQEDVNTAKDLVNKLPDGTVKDDLNNRLDKVQDTIDKAKEEKAKQDATEAVETAEASKKQDDVDKAKELVNALPEGTVKDDLTNRLDKVQEEIDKANTPTTPDTDGTNNGGGSANGETILAGTPLNQDISVLVKGGELSLTNSNINPFNDIELGESTKTVSTDFTAPFTVKDLTGNQLGYRVDVSASQLTDGTNTLPKGTLSLHPVSKIERVGIGNGEKPTSKLASNQILDDGKSTLISANVGEGMGVFALTFPDNALSISLNPTTAKIDGDSAVYTSTITWDLVQAP